MPSDRKGRSRPEVVTEELSHISEADRRVSVIVNRTLQEEMRKLKAERRQTQLYVEEQMRKRR